MVKRPEKTKQTEKKASRPDSGDEAIPRGIGRPTVYRAEFADQARRLCLLGATDAEMAGFFDVYEATINRWKIDHPLFCESIARGKISADAKIAEALYHRAKGYRHPEDDIKSVNGEIVVTPTIKHYPPDTNAASLWLRNRQPKKWRDKHEPSSEGIGQVNELRRLLFEKDEDSK